jgi:hypothetical protein
MKHKFTITLYGEATIELDDDVINAVDDEWRSSFYQLHSKEDIAEHIGYNLIINNITLSHMDGWADMLNHKASIIEYPDWEVTATELLDGKP